MPSAACSEELETLTAIFLDEISINDDLPDDGAQVSMVLFPATGDDEESRYVTLTLEILLCKNYPKVPPQIVFRNPRGLNDEMLDDLMRNMKERCEESIDSQMIYELIDMGKEFLTRNNRPASECPICLLAFTEFDAFFRSDCFHHFHSHCLGNYLQNILNASDNEPSSSMNGRSEPKELNCPVCRERFSSNLDVSALVAAPPPSEEFDSINKDSETVLQEWEDKRQSMKELYEKQKSQGGIIDLSDKKKLLVISSNRDNPSNGAADSASARVEISSTDSTSAGVRVVSGEPTSVPCVEESDRSSSQSRQRRNSNGMSNISKNRGIPPPNPNHTVPNPVAANVVSKQNSDSGSNESQQRPVSATDESEDGRGGRSGNSNYRKFKRGEGYNRRRHK